jgi:surface antigen
MKRFASLLVFVCMFFSLRITSAYTLPSSITKGGVTYNNIFAAKTIDAYGGKYGFILYTDSATSHYYALGSPKAMRVDTSGQISVEGSGQVYYGTGCNEDLSVCDYQSGSLSASYFNSMFYCQYGGCQYSQVPTNLWTATWQQYWSTNKIVDANGGTIYYPGSQLTVTLNPQAGGTVLSAPDTLTCNGNTCQENPTSGLAFITASPSTGYAFGYWINGVNQFTDNPLQVNMNGNETLTAKFFMTFINRVGNFQASVGSTIDTGECVPYVRYETGVPIYGDAYTWYQQAIDANYATNNSVPRIGSIIVFDIQGNMTAGHVGIVTSINGTSLGIRSQNWHNDLKVSDDVIDVSAYTIKGYIYYTP